VLRGWSALLRGATLLTAVLCAVAISACQPSGSGALSSSGVVAGSSTVSRSLAGGSGAADGEYAGSDPSLSISFSASSGAISNIAGSAIVTCIESSQNPGLNQSDPFQIHGPVPLSSDGSFSASTSTSLSGGGTLIVSVQGRLDGQGHASGTFRSDAADVCDTGVEQWSASIGGSSVAPEPAAGASADASHDGSSDAGCSPAPCGTSGGVTLYVDRLGLDRGATGDPTDTIVVYFHLSNSSPTEQQFGGSLDSYQIESGGVASAVGGGENDGLLPDGSPCNDDDATLPPGASSQTLHACIQVSPEHESEPLTLVWSGLANPGGIGGSIDISGLPLTPLG